MSSYLIRDDQGFSVVKNYTECVRCHKSISENKGVWISNEGEHSCDNNPHTPGRASKTTNYAIGQTVGFSYEGTVMQGQITAIMPDERVKVENHHYTLYVPYTKIWHLSRKRSIAS